MDTDTDSAYIPDSGSEDSSATTTNDSSASEGDESFVFPAENFDAIARGDLVAIATSFRTLYEQTAALHKKVRKQKKKTKKHNKELDQFKKELDQKPSEEKVKKLVNAKFAKVLDPGRRQNAEFETAVCKLGALFLPPPAFLGDDRSVYSLMTLWNWCRHVLTLFLDSTIDITQLRAPTLANSVFGPGDKLPFVKAGLAGAISYITHADEEDLKSFPHKRQRDAVSHNGEFLEGLYGPLEGEEDLVFFDSKKEKVKEFVKNINLDASAFGNYKSLDDLVDAIETSLENKGFTVPGTTTASVKNQFGVLFANW